MSLKNFTKPTDYLGIVLDGYSMETLVELLADPSANHPPGVLARLGAAFSNVADALTAAAKDQMTERLTSGITHETDAGVLFQYRGPSEAVVINTKEVKATFPESEYPELYSRQQRKASIAITL